MPDIERQKLKEPSAPHILSVLNQLVSQDYPETLLPRESRSAHENEWYSFKDFDDYRVTEQPLYKQKRFRVIFVGAGAAGLDFAHKADKFLKNVDWQIYEKNHDIGGTWLENRYPGCTCDIPSHSYQFAWARKENWSSYYASAEEIWQYMKDVATKFGLERNIKFNTKVESASWDEDEGHWNLNLATSGGLLFKDSCDILINGTGALNEQKLPQIEGIELFKGKLMHSAKWDSSFDLTGKRVAVIGGGSSAIQIVPSIQPVVGKLYSFLRSPTWITSSFAAKYAGPGGTNYEYSDEQIREFREQPEKYVEYCCNVEGELSKRFNLMHLNSEDQNKSRKEVAKTMAEQLRNDPELVKHLIPSYSLGCRRITPGSGYLSSLQKDNVQVVCRGATRFTENGVVDEAGVEYNVDAIICATGFNTSFTPHFKVYGKNNTEIHKQFGDFPVGYLSIMARNFPNLFLLPGPNGPASHGSILPILDWIIRYIFQAVEKMQKENIKFIEPKQEAVRDLYNHTHELMKRLVWSTACRSWFKNGKTQGPVTAIYPGSRLHFFEIMKSVRWEDYDIMYHTNNRFQFMGNGYTETELEENGNVVWYFDDPFLKA